MVNLDRARAIFTAATQKWGVSSQLDVAIEEMAELIQSLVKLRRAGLDARGPERAHVVEEIADVLVMGAQLRFLFDAPAVDAVVERKIARLESRLEMKITGTGARCPQCNAETFCVVQQTWVLDEIVEIWRCSACNHVERR